MYEPIVKLGPVELFLVRRGFLVETLKLLNERNLRKLARQNGYK